MAVLLYDCTTITLTKCQEKKLHKDAACCFEQILEAAPYKTAVQPLTSHLTNHSSKTKKDMQGTSREVSMNP